MGERNVDLSAYVPPDVKGDKGNVGSTGGQVQVELEDEDDHFSAPGAKQQATAPKPAAPTTPAAPPKPRYSKATNFVSYQAGTRR